MVARITDKSTITIQQSEIQSTIKDHPINNAIVDYVAEHGVGFHPAASGSFLKSVVVMYGRAK